MLTNSELSRNARLLYLTLDNHQRLKNSSWPRQSFLARELGCGVRSVQRYLSELHRAGFCFPERSVSGGPNRYRLFHSYHATELSLPRDRIVATHTTELAGHKAIQEMNPDKESPLTPRKRGELRCSWCRGKGQRAGCVRGSCPGCQGTGMEVAA